MANNDLLKWVTSDVDFYSLLGLPFSQFSSSELRRAYRKTSLKYHPDKLGKDFDPEKYELFQSAYGVLEDEELKAKYDNHRQAKLQKQRANELFEGKRRTMKEDLEARERGGLGKRQREEEEEGENEMQVEMRRLAEEGRKRRAARQSMMATNVPLSPAQPPAPKEEPKPKPQSTSPEVQPEEEDEIAVLERRIREAEQAKAKRKAEKKARKSGVFVPADSPSVPSMGRSKVADQNMATPIKRPDIFKGLRADDKSSASPKFSFSPTIPTPKRKDFTATMERLKAAEKSRLEEEIRREESESAV